MSITKERLKELKDKLMKKLREAFTDVEITELKAALKDSEPGKVNLEGTPMEFKTKDGASVFISGLGTDGKVAKDLKVFTDAAGTIAAADGPVVLEDGTTVTVAGGIITDVKAPEPAKDPVQEMNTQMSAHKANIERSFEVRLQKQKLEFQVELEKVRKANASLLKFVDKVLDTEIVVQAAQKEKKLKDPKDMTNAELARHNRGEEIFVS
jgi:hypothetical protein